jgi:hypothetical protein
MVIGYMEIDPNIVSKTNLIDIIIDSKPLNRYLSKIEKIVLDLYWVGEKIYYLILFYPGDEALHVMRNIESFKVYTTQWKALDISPAFNNRHDLRFDYLFSLSNLYIPQQRPPIKVARKVELDIPKIYIYNHSVPISFTGLKLPVKPAADSILITMLNPYGLVKEELDYDDYRYIVNYILYKIDNMDPLINIRNLSRYFLSLRDYITLIKNQFKGRKCIVITPFVDLSTEDEAEYYIILYNKNTIEEHKLDREKKLGIDINDIKFRFSIERNYIVYGFHRIAVRQSVHINGIGIPDSKRHCQVLIDNKLYIDSGSKPQILYLPRMLSESF